MPAPDGRRLVVAFRPADRIAATEELLASRGFAAAVAPLLEPAALPGPAFSRFAIELTANRVDVVVFTSPYGPRFAGELAEAERVEEFFDLLRARHLAAIGPRTAEAMAQAGLRAGTVASEHTSAGLGRDLARRARGATVALLRSAHGDPDLAGDLAEAGAQVLDVPLYDLREPPRGEAHARVLEVVRGATADAFAFTSPLTVERFLAWMEAEGEDARRALARAQVGAIGPPTARACAAAGLEKVIVPPEATFEALVDALAAQLR